jgi:hypothetical protein
VYVSGSLMPEHLPFRPDIETSGSHRRLCERQRDALARAR